MPTALRTLSLSLAAALACRSAPVPPPAPAAPPLPVRAEWRLPADWTAVEPFAFERMVLEALPEGSITPLADESLQELATALARMDASSVRAAVVLGRSLDPRAARVLIRRLESRVQGPERASDAGDVVAAAALTRFPGGRRFSKRLRDLGTGRGAHPDLEVRTECACSALSWGRTAVVPFLLQVLRIGTPAGEADARDFEVSPTTAWARGRAAEALSLHAGLPVGYRTDAPLAERDREADRLAEALGRGEQAEAERSR